MQLTHTHSHSRHTVPSVCFTCTNNCLTSVMVEESVLPPKDLRRLHDDGIRKLISHCCLTYSLERNVIHKDQYIYTDEPPFYIHWLKHAYTVQQKHYTLVLLSKSWAICGETALHLVPQVFGRAAYVSVEVRHVDKLCDAGLSGCLGNLLRDGHEDILEAIVPFTQKEEKYLRVSAHHPNYNIYFIFKPSLS